MADEKQLHEAAAKSGATLSMTRLHDLAEDRSRHADCPACGQSVGLQFDAIHSTFEFEEREWEVNRRVCGECGHADATAKHSGDELTVILTLAHPSKTCFACDNRAIATVVEMEGTDPQHTDEHFCEEHASDQIRTLHHRVKRLSMEVEGDSRE